MPGVLSAAEAFLRALTQSHSDGAENVGVDVVNHNGIRSRSLQAAHAFGKGDVLLSNAPEHVIRAADVHGRRFDGCQDDACKLALDIAEARAARPASDGYWQKALETFPEFSDFEALGVPLAANDKALATLSQVPEFQTLLPFIQQTRGTMLSAVDVYNRSAELHPALTFSDALWGRLVVESYAFANTPCGLHLAPLASWVNHSLQPNVSYNCDARGVTVSALQPLAPQSELQATYNKLGPLANFAKYGIIEDAASVQPLSPSSCTRLQLSPEAKEPLLRAASKLASIHCPGSVPDSLSLPPAAKPLPALKPAPVNPPATGTAEGLQWGSLPLPMTQIPGISNLLYGPRPYVPLSPSAWEHTLPMMIPSTAHMPLHLVALAGERPWRTKSRSRDASFLT